MAREVTIEQFFTSYSNMNIKNEIPIRNRESIRNI